RRFLRVESACVAISLLLSLPFTFEWRRSFSRIFVGTSINWTEVQDQLKKKLIAYDDFPWKGKYELLLYVEFTMTTLLSPFMFHMSMGFLPFVSSSSPSFILESKNWTFRVTCYLLLQILQIRRDDKHPFYSQFRLTSLTLLSLHTKVLMVDGNGILHVRGFGLACHLGVRAHLPPIGRSFQMKVNQEQVITLVRNSGFTFQQGFRPTMSSLKLLYVSVGPHTI
ncbi:hypothetical protein HID58_012943, partial [Brassica napus]